MRAVEPSLNDQGFGSGAGQVKIRGRRNVSACLSRGEKKAHLALPAKVSSLRLIHVRGASQGISTYFGRDVSNNISRECQREERSCNLPQRSWCKGTIIRISYYLVHRVCNHWR